MSQDEDYQLTLRDYLSILKRRALLIAVTFIGVAAVAIAVAMLMPPVYQSTGTIMIESQQIPTDLVQASVTSYADERIEVIKQRVMTRDNLLRIISKYDLFKDRSITFTPSEQVDEMRQLITVQLINANVRQGKGSATIAFKVSFEDRQPQIAQRVANELVTLFLNENVKVRTERATQTTEFLTQEANRLKTQLDQLEGQIATYKQQNNTVLPENIALSMNAIQRMETEMRDAEREYRSAEEEVRSLDIELAGAKAAVANAAANASGSPIAGLNADEAELQKARSELARMANTYTDSHPDVRATKRRIEALEKSIAETAKLPRPSVLADGSPLSASPTVAAAQMVVSKIEARRVSAQSRMQLMRAQQGELRARLADAEAQLVKAPQVERGLAALLRDREGAQRKYEEIRAKQMSAQLSENLEDEQRAERFSLLEPPLAPDRPIKPNRKKMIALGLVLAGVAAGGLTMLLEMLHGTVRGAEAVTAITGKRPLVLIPYITIAEENQRQRRYWKRLIIGAVVALVAALLAIHFFFMPLDTLVFKLLLRLS